MVKIYRHSYEAKVLVVSLGELSQEAAREVGGMGATRLGHITCVNDGVWASVPLGASWVDDAGRQGLDLVDLADVVVLLATDLAGIDPSTMESLGKALEESGTLNAALLVDVDAGADMAHQLIRETFDMVVRLRAVTSAAAMLDTLRGGERDRMVTPR